MTDHSRVAGNAFFVSAAGHRLRAQTLVPERRGERPALVFLHEGLGSIAQWRDFPQALVSKSGCPALVYERYGFGASDRLAEPRTERYLHDEAQHALPEVLDACEIDRAIVIGHSDGGSIALIFAAAYPERVEGVVVEGTHVFVDELTRPGIRAAVKAYEQGAFKERLARYHGDNTESMFRGWCDTWLSPRFSSWNIEDCLPAIRCPVLAIHGEDDEYGTRAQMEAIARQVAGPVEALLLPGCGHAPHFHARERVLAAIAAFVARIKAQAR